MKFSEYSFLVESLDSEFVIHENPRHVEFLNSFLGSKIVPVHTKSFHSDVMARNGLHIARIMDAKHKHIEYHLHSFNGAPGAVVEPNRKSMVHAIKIIHDDALDQIKKHGRKVLIQAASDQQYNRYKGIADHIAKKTGRKITELGNISNTSNPNQKLPAFLIEELNSYSSPFGVSNFILSEQLIFERS